MTNTTTNLTDLIQQSVHSAVGETPTHTIDNLQLVWDSAKETAETEGMSFMNRAKFHYECNEYFMSIATK